MFEGQRLSYVVPGYTGYTCIHSVIFPRKFTTSSNLLDSLIRLEGSRVMLVMSMQSNLRIYTAILLARLLSMWIINLLWRVKTSRPGINTSVPTLLVLFLLLNDSNALLLTSSVSLPALSESSQYTFTLYSLQAPVLVKKSTSLHKANRKTFMKVWREMTKNGASQMWSIKRANSTWK